jgi:hypothetical protein
VRDGAVGRVPAPAAVVWKNAQNLSCLARLARVLRGEETAMDAPSPTDKSPKRSGRSRAGSGSSVSTLINVLLVVGVAIILGLVIWSFMTESGRAAVAAPSTRAASAARAGRGGGGGTPSVVTVNSNTAAAVKSLAGRFRGNAA